MIKNQPTREHILTHLKHLIKGAPFCGENNTILTTLVYGYVYMQLEIDHSVTYEYNSFKSIGFLQ